MGQARNRGTFEERKQQAILRHEEEKRREEEYRRLHPPQPSKRLPMVPLYMDIAMANIFPYYLSPNASRRKYL